MRSQVEDRMEVQEEVRKLNLKHKGKCSKNFARKEI